MFKPGLVLVTGGAASGKSAFAERVCASTGNKLLYIAAMKPFGEGAEERIARHRAMRAGKGFETLEQYTRLPEAPVAGDYDAILLEDTGNLLANELFDAKTPAREIIPSVLEGLTKLGRHTGTVVVVGNDVFCGGESFCGEMQRYASTLAALHREIALRADCVAECVCGIPIPKKGVLL